MTLKEEWALDIKEQVETKEAKKAEESNISILNGKGEMMRSKSVSNGKSESNGYEGKYSLCGINTRKGINPTSEAME